MQSDERRDEMVHWGSGGGLAGPECGVGGRAGGSYRPYAREVEVSSQTDTMPGSGIWT